MAQNPINYWTSATYIGGYHIKCNGQNTGSIKANPNFGTGPHTFLWNTGETTAQINNKGAGIYYVTMTDSLNVSHTDTFELRQPYALSYQSTLSDFYGYNISSYGGNNGTIQLSATGGTPPYRYTWNNGSPSAGVGAKQAPRLTWPVGVDTCGAIGIESALSRSRRRDAVDCGRTVDCDHVDGRRDGSARKRTVVADPRHCARKRRRRD